MTNTEQLTDQQRAEQYAAGLERLAAFMRANPQWAAELNDKRFLAYLMPGDTVRTKMAEFVRAGLRAGATIDKEVTDDYAKALLRFGPITIQVYTEREEVCERVVTATHEVVEEVPDPEALAAATASVPLVKKITTVEDVEWVCTPLLAVAQTELDGAVA